MGNALLLAPSDSIRNMGIGKENMHSQGFTATGARNKLKLEVATDKNP